MQKNIELDPVSKLDEVTSLLNAYSPKAHTKEEAEYAYLEDGCLCITTENNDGETLYLELTDEFSLFFDTWHTHYSADEDGYDACTSDIIAILNNEKYVFVVESKGKWMGSSLESKDVSKESSCKKILKELGYNSFIREIKETGAVIHFKFWDTSFNRDLTYIKQQ